MKQTKLLWLFISIATFLFLIPGSHVAAAQHSPGELVEVLSIGPETLIITVKAGEYRITIEDSGQKIAMDGFGYLMTPGKPMLPAKNFLIALPPGARVQSVEVAGTGASQLPGTYRVVPTPPILPMVDPLQYSELVEKMQREWQKNREAVYSTDQAYPKERGKLTGSGTLRKYSYASVSFYPFEYRPQSGRLIYYDAAQIIVNYSLPSPGSDDAQRVEELKWDTLADERASSHYRRLSKLHYRLQPPELEGLFRI
jgi:hypothetical protein